MAVELLHDVPISYINNTGRNDFALVVFTKNEDRNAIDTPFVAWRTLKAQSSATFAYPVRGSVAAIWKFSGVECTAGPFPAERGSTWVVRTVGGSPFLSQDKVAQDNLDGVVVVRNITSSSCVHGPFSFGLYKSGNLLATQSKVGRKSQAVFQLTTKLYFGVVKDIRVGQIFKALTTTLSHIQVDLLEFSNGVVIQLDLNGASGEYTFTSTDMYRNVESPCITNRRQTSAKRTFTNSFPDVKDSVEHPMPQKKKARITARNVTTLYVRKEEDKVYNALLLESLTVHEFKVQLSKKYDTPAEMIKNVFKVTKKGLQVNFDDSMMAMFQDEDDLKFDMIFDRQNRYYDLLLSY